jgi:hypothetical protein
MAKQLEDFPQAIADELTNWQHEDMRRAYPNTTLEDCEASTLIWPRSRMSEQDEKLRRQQMVRRAKWPPHARRQQRAPAGTAGRVKSTRPILRESLFDQLVDRMDKLMEDDLSWA